MSTVTDVDLPLVAQACQGDYSAFEQLVTKYEQRVYRLSYSILLNREDAEDTVQQTFLSMIEHLSDFRAEARFATWLLRIATNQALKILQKRKPFTSLEVTNSSGESYQNLPRPDFIAPWRDNPEVLAAQRETQQLLATALEKLPDHYRLVFLLRDVEEFSTTETAALLGLTVANVKVRLLRARLMLREQLTAQLGDTQARMIPDHVHE